MAQSGEKEVKKTFSSAKFNSWGGGGGGYYKLYRPHSFNQGENITD